MTPLLTRLQAPRETAGKAPFQANLRRYLCPVTRRDLALIAETRAALADRSARQRRIDTRIRLTEIAAVIGVVPSAVSQWENGIRQPDAEHTLAYARALAAAEQKAA